MLFLVFILMGLMGFTQSSFFSNGNGEIWLPIFLSDQPSSMINQIGDPYLKWVGDLSEITLSKGFQVKQVKTNLKSIPLYELCFDGTGETAFISTQRGYERRQAYSEELRHPKPVEFLLSTIEPQIFWERNLTF